jgi:3-oxoacyl-[acyl-carrier protein] reductase
VEQMLEGKTAIITGGGRGIGRASALHLAQLGARVAVVDDGSAPNGDGRDEVPAAGVAAEIVARGGEAQAEVVDVTDEAEVDSLFARTLQRWESLDILVNVAGNIRVSTIVDATPAEWERVLRTHLLGTYLTSRRAAQHWVERATYGRLINFSSVAGLNVGFPALLSYSTAKAGIIGFTRACASLGTSRWQRTRACRSSCRVLGQSGCRQHDGTRAWRSAGSLRALERTRRGACHFHRFGR